MEWINFFLLNFAALFSVVNPLGAMPVFLSLTSEDTAAERLRLAKKGTIYFSVILIISYLLGNYILAFFGISIDAMRIAGGMIILNSGYQLLSGDFAKTRAIDEGVRTDASEKDDISLTPLAIPLLAGPGSISFLIGVHDQQPGYWYTYGVVVGIILSVALIAYLILAVSPYLTRRLGASGMNSVSRIIGFIVMSIGVQYIINGVTSVLEQVN